jgi:hypothetical protein
MSSKNAYPIVYCKSISLLGVLVALIGMLLIMQAIRSLAAAQSLSGFDSPSVDGSD